MTLIFIIALIIVISLSPTMVQAPQPDIIPCKDGYQIVYELVDEDGNTYYDEYFVYDLTALDDLEAMGYGKIPCGN